MLIGKVIGNVWATRKEESLNGLKLMVVQRIDPFSDKDLDTLVAVDFVGAGIGEKVLVATGSAARKSIAVNQAPVDATIIGIIDAVEISRD
ncbi:MAG: EutN/CcmL family microcompartment protein [Desulfoprunum sp.]|nr:EutN/CcmL family microcompartment protein [Desulfoprunum sp.]